MKKNVMMRVASLLMVCVLATTCGISGTFAKYVTSTSSDDHARVAVWGINADAVSMNLFRNDYGDVVSKDGDKVIAPGTTGTSNFSILNTSALAPEVKYEIAIDVSDSKIAPSVENNPNVVWKLDSGEFGTWDQLMEAILLLSGSDTGSKVYEANEVAPKFATGETHTITWEWKFENDANGNGSFADEDAYDTALGNAALEQDILVELVIKITATQVND